MISKHAECLENNDKSLHRGRTEKKSSLPFYNFRNRVNELLTYENNQICPIYRQMQACDRIELLAVWRLPSLRTLFISGNCR